MSNKTLIFTLIMSVLMEMGETASAVTFSCPATLDVSKFQRGAITQHGGSYRYQPPPISKLTINVEYSQPVTSSLTLNWWHLWFVEGVKSDNPDNPKNKKYKLASATLKNALLGHDGEPICFYDWNFPGLMFFDGKSYIESYIKTTDVHNCTLSGTTFTCP